MDLITSITNHSNSPLIGFTLKNPKKSLCTISIIDLERMSRNIYYY